MSLSDEKMLILKMLQEGKITSEEAARLLDAVDGDSGQSDPENASRQYKQMNFQDEITKMREKVNAWKKEFKNNYNQNDFDHAVEEFAEKAERLGKNLAATTFGIVDKMIDYVGSYVDTSSFNIFGNYTTVEKSFETAASEGMEFEIEGVNGHIVIKKHLDNKIVVKSKIRTPAGNADDIVVYDQTCDYAGIKLNKSGNISVSHEILLPAVKFKKLKAETSNGKIYIEDSIAEDFEVLTRNGNIDLMGVNSDKISVSTRNARIQLSYIVGKEVEINTNNAVIDMKHIKADNITANNQNGRITMENVQNPEDSSEINISLKTTNGGIKVNMNDMDGRGYKVRAKTTNNGINLLIPELTYHNINRQGVGGSFVEAESNEYGNYHERVNVNAETVNGFIEIVK